MAARHHLPKWHLCHPLHESVSNKLIYHSHHPRYVADNLCLMLAISLTAVIVSRFLLDLQAANEKAVACASDPYGPSDAVQTLVFERIVGSLASESASVWEESPSERESRQAAGDDENCMEHCRVSSEPDEHTADSAPGARDVESKC